MRRETMGNNRKWQEMTGNELIVSIIDRLEKDRKQQEITGQVRTGKNSSGKDRKQRETTGNNKKNRKQGQDKKGNNLKEKETTGNYRTGHDKSGQNRTGQVRK